jgi:5-methyltetrahydrofolate corrinoid/iron sulfur protein methyltransferase
MMLLIGENVNIMSETIGPALRGRNPKPIQELARAETEAGVDYLDLNIGPARKAGDELMTCNPAAMEAGLKVHKGRALINSISLQPERLEPELPLVKKYDADMIGLLWGTEGMPRDAAERCVLVVDLVYRANQLGIPNRDIWIDPILTPTSGEINQVKACFEFMSMLNDIAPECKSVVGLDGEKPDLSSLSQKEAEYVKTVRVLTGEALYSHSWLEI